MNYGRPCVLHCDMNTRAVTGLYVSLPEMFQLFLVFSRPDILDKRVSLSNLLKTNQSKPEMELKLF